MRDIFTPDNLLARCERKSLHQFRHRLAARCISEIEPAVAAAGAEAMEACMASSITQARQGTLFLILGGDPALVERMDPLLAAISSARRYVGPTGRAAQVKALVNMVMNINTAGLAEGLGLGAALGTRPQRPARGVRADRREFPRAGDRRRRHAEPRARVLFFRRPCRQGFRHRRRAGRRRWGVRAPLAEAALAQYQLMIDKGLGELDKSGVAELTFKDRAK